ncbi:MAG: hypothetical protein EB072_20995 [Betaproteobacteria bacterium]|nr:hypothetical protein [Betaproteobacteria bacterium]
MNGISSPYTQRSLRVSDNLGKFIIGTRDVGWMISVLKGSYSYGLRVQFKQKVNRLRELAHIKECQDDLT